MLQAGDELGRTQGGNNNAYCQDNGTSWLDWSAAGAASRLTEFTRRLISLRKRRPELRRETFLKGARGAGRADDVSWLHPGGREMTPTDWQDPTLHCLGVRLAAEESQRGADLLVIFNAGGSPVEFVLPAVGAGSEWMRSFDTAQIETVLPDRVGPTARVEAHSSSICELSLGATPGETPPDR